ncbi:MAG: LysR family transcriptional regulator [Nevskiaceae bacterium]|nr:MAG: LysR family transcriptional regulator [Nevskiaceae bacterium]TBR71971.1 MAG: LysR family transcriptional regulator [Nevskiaceae bacterium]
MNTLDPLKPYLVFIRVLEVGSFSAVARETGTTQSTISKQIAALERSLRVTLFARTTRRLQPTDEALRLYEHVRQLLDAVEALRATDHPNATAATGTLRVTVPGSYGRRRILPLIPRFIECYPKVQLDITLTDQVADLIAEGFELGIRIGVPSSNTLIARPLDVVDQFPVATSEYLDRHGSPNTPADLSRHACIVYNSSSRWAKWEFESDESGHHAVEVRGPICANDPDAMYEMVRAHMGIALIPGWVVAEDLALGHINSLLPDYYPIPLPVNIVYPHTRFLSRRARCFVDFLIEEIRHPGPAATSAAQ